MKVICVYDDALSELKKESNIAYSDKVNAFIMKDDTFEMLNKKYNFEHMDEVSVFDTLEEFLEMIWEDEEVEIPLTFTDEKSVNIELVEDAEIGAESYEKNYKNQEKSISELLASKDWYDKIYKNTVISMLSVFLDSTTMAVEGLINGYKQDK